MTNTEKAPLTKSVTFLRHPLLCLLWPWGCFSKWCYTKVATTHMEWNLNNWNYKTGFWATLTDVGQKQSCHVPIKFKTWTWFTHYTRSIKRNKANKQRETFPYSVFLYSWRILLTLMIIMVIIRNSGPRSWKKDFPRERILTYYPTDLKSLN